MLNKIFLFLLFSTILFANVSLKLPPHALINEPYKFIIEASGESIKFPKLSTINGNIVQELSSSNSTNIINSQITKKIKKTFVFTPSSDFIFPSLEFKIDGKTYKTDEKKVELKKPEKTKSDLFDLEIKLSKNSVYVGENIILTIVFKYKKDLQIVDLSFNKTDFKDFWYKQLDKNKNYEESGYIVQELKFLMIPLKNGNIKINPLGITAQIMDVNSSRSFSLFSSVTKDIKIFSNELNLEVKQLPNNVKLIGEFDIKSTIDKRDIKRGEAVSFKINISGIGNIEDVPDIKLDIKEATIYENKPKIVTKILNDEISGSYEKVFSIIPNESIKIPSIKIEYFNKENKKISALTTPEYKVTLQESQNNSNLNKKNTLEKKSFEKNSKEITLIKDVSYFEKGLYFILGIIVTLFIFAIYYYFTNKKREKQQYNTPLLNRIKNSKTKDELLKILAIYINFDKQLDELIFKLEKSNEIEVIKKQIKDKIKQLKL